MVAAPLEAMVLWVAAGTSAVLATPAMAKVLAMRVRARTALTSAVAPTAGAMLARRAAMVEAVATAAVMAGTLAAPATLAMTVTWVVPVRARMAATSAVALRGAVTPVTKETMVAMEVTAEAATVEERSSPRSFETAGACQNFRVRAGCIRPA